MAKLLTEDERKIHAEVTQIAQQRFVLTTVAITMLGVAGGWGLSRDSHGDLGPPVFWSTALLNVVLCALFLYSLSLLNMLRTLTVYLELNGSAWEGHWQRYNSGHGVWAYTRSQGAVFFALIFVSSLGAHLLGCAYQTAWPGSVFYAIHIAVGAVSLLVVGAFSFTDRLKNKLINAERKKARWEKILADMPHS